MLLAVVALVATLAIAANNPRVTVGVSGSVATTSSVQAPAATSSTPEATTAISAAATQPATVAPTSPEPAMPKKTMIIAWQPSHQADTAADWDREYVICGDIADRVIAKLSEYPNVKAWDIRHGKTGTNNYRPNPTNTKAFDNEVELANAADADVFIGLHVDSGALEHWLLGEVLPGDAKGEALCDTLLGALSDELGWKKRPARAARLYSLEPVRNDAKYKCLLEIGDNEKDRAFLENPKNRDRIASALAEGIREFDSNH